MSTKYELTDETKKINGITLHRIRALRDIPNAGVKTGDSAIDEKEGGAK